MISRYVPSVVSESPDGAFVKFEDHEAEVAQLRAIAHEAWLVALACQFAPEIESQKLYGLCADYGKSPLASDIWPETTKNSLPSESCPRSQSGLHTLVDDGDVRRCVACNYQQCEHGAGLTDYCEPCGRIHGGG